MNQFVCAAAVIALTSPLFAEDAPVAKKLAGDFKFTEGPALGPEGRIFFVDIPNARIHVYDPKTGRTGIHRENSGGANGLQWTADGTLYACEGKARRISRQKGDAIETVVDKFEGRRLNAPNDLVLDRAGGLYFTDPAYGLKDTDRELAVEAVYYVAKDGSLKQLIKELKRPNGITLAPDGGTLYVADAGGSAIWKYPVTAPGQLGEGTKVAGIGSDGMVLDPKGNMLCTWKGAVVVLDPAGRELRSIPLPEGPSNLELVDGRLYVTARTSFYELPYQP